MEVWKIVFHSILEIFHSIPFWHLPYSIPKFPFHSIFHSISCPALENQNEALTRLAEALSNLNTSTSQNSRQADAAAVSAVSVKLSEFWPEDPEVWFIRVEAQLRSRSVTQDQTKFDYVVASLDNSTAAEVKAVLLHPPAANKYDAIKEALLGAFGKTPAQKDAELLNISGLGDRTPSALLRKLESLNNNADTLRRAFFFFFLAQLPIQVRSILSIQDFATIQDLAKVADRIVEARNISHTVVSAASATRQPLRFHQTPVAKPKPSRENFICSYHQRFGPDARNCSSGCLFAKLLPSRQASKQQHQENANTGRQ